MKRQRSIVACLAVTALLFGTAVWAEDENQTADQTVWVTSIAQIGDSDQFVAATANGLLLREAGVASFAASDPTTLAPIYTHPAAVWCVESTTDGNTIASVDYRGNLVVYDTKTKKPTTHEKAFERWCQAMIISPDNKTIVAGNEAGKVITWDLAAGKVDKSVELDGHAVTGLAISPDGSQIAASDGGGHIHLLSWPGLEQAGKIEVSQETVWCVAYVADGKLVAGSSDRHLYRVDAKADAKSESISKGTDWITQLAVAPGGQVAAAEVGGRLHFPVGGGTDSMDATSGIWALCWNGDQQLLAGTRKDGIVMAGRSWKWSDVPKPAPAPTAEKPTAEAKPAEEKPAEKPAAEKPAAEKPAAEKPAAEKPAAEKPAAEKPPAEKPAAEKPAAEKPDAEKPAAEKPDEASQE